MLINLANVHDMQVEVFDGAEGPSTLVNPIAAPRVDQNRGHKHCDYGLAGKRSGILLVSAGILTTEPLADPTVLLQKRDR